ncbi:unnamed protein product [Phytomonas sp. EM1]|nr:unnamed protein product [Phytomonas sp. EM1]|eukprot:CCW63371.1 unnamed protein product [Phytomonas sp. isolate EM1]
MLDAGVAARQSASRKNIRKARRPFENYFRTTFRCSLPTSSVVGRRGVLSAYAATRLMSDPHATWSPPWGRSSSRGFVRTRRKRTDALERPADVFGEDELDGVLSRLLKLRFSWDREDGILATALLPRGMFRFCEHALPYAAVGNPTRGKRTQVALDVDSESDPSEEILTIDGASVILRNPMGSGAPPNPGWLRQNDCHTGVAPKTKWSLTGVNAIPTFVADIVRGPFLSSPHYAELTLRWKAENRHAESVSEVLQLYQRIGAASVVGLPPRSALLLLFSLATVEIETPALEVSLGIAMGENYHGYEKTECLEILRCLRRLAFVRNLPTIAPLTSSPPPSSFPVDGLDGVPSLYEDASLTEGFLGRFIADVAPFFAVKVWARLPEHSERLLRRHLYLDWIDLLYLALGVNGNRLPSRLPNPVSAAAYASKYLFLRYTLHIDEIVMANLVAGMRGGAPSHSCLPSNPTRKADVDSESEKEPHPNIAREAGSPPHANGIGPGGNQEEAPFMGQDEDPERNLILWMSTSFLVRLISEALGDVLKHVGTYLQQCAQLLSHGGLGEPVIPGGGEGLLPSKTPLHGGGVESISPMPAPQPSGARLRIHDDHLEAYLDRLKLYRPRVAGEATHLLGRRHPKKVRVRLLPYESFPDLARGLPLPFQKVMRQAGLAGRSTPPPPPSPPSPSLSQGVPIPNGRKDARKTPSTVASHIAQSGLASSQVGRAADALGWATMVLHHCLGMVQGLPPLDLRPPTSDAIVERRRAYCRRFAQSKIQLLMDELFFYIPWEEIETHIEPLLASEQEGRTADPNIDQEPSFLTAFSDECGEDDSQKDSPNETDEQRGQILLRNLQMRVDEFQLSVADLLEAYEGFFGQEEGNAEDTNDGINMQSEGEGLVHLDTQMNP